MNRNEIIKQAIAAYGKDAQTDICIEECSELTKALLKYRRNDRFGQTCNEHELTNIRYELQESDTADESLIKKQETIANAYEKYYIKLVRALNDFVDQDW